jgi:tetratricopeptide (TPR) repeat protein
MLGWNGRFAEGIELIERSLPIIQEIGNRFRLAWGKMVLSLSRLFLGNYADAIRLGNEARELSRADRLDREEAASLIAIGCAMLSQDDYASGLERLEESAAIYQKIRYRDELGWALGGVSLAYHFLGQPQQARQNLCEALRIVLEVKGIYTLISGLPASALLLLEGGQVEKAVEVCALVRRKVCVYNNLWFEEIAGRKVDERLAELPPQIREQAEQRGRECNTYELVAVLLQELTGESAILT